MDYIKEINAFEKWLETNPDVTDTPQLLWYKLMSVNNGCFWLEWFTCSNTTLMNRMGIKQSKTLDCARKKLVDCNRIKYIPGGNRKVAGRYSIIPLVQYSTVKNTVEKVAEMPLLSPTIEVSDVKNTTVTTTLIKENETTTTDLTKPVLELKLDLDDKTDIKTVLDYYLRVAGKDMENGSDRNTALALIAVEGITFEIIKAGIDKSKKNYKGRYKSERMSFAYCKPAIFELYDGVKERSKLSGQVKRSAESDNGSGGGQETDERTRRIIEATRGLDIGDTKCDY